MVRKVPVERYRHEHGPEYVPEHVEDDYLWYEMGFFTRWDDPDHCQVLCVDAPNQLPSDLQKQLCVNTSEGPVKLPSDPQKQSYVKTSGGPGGLPPGELKE